MDAPIRSTLWSAYGVLVVLIVAGLALTVGILHLSNQQEYRIVEGSGPLLDAVSAMNDDTLAIMSAARGFALTKRTQFQQQYDEAVRDFSKSSTSATHVVTDPRDAQRVAKMRTLFDEIKGYTDQEMLAAHDGRDANANEYMVAAAKAHSSAPDYAGTMADEHAREEHRDLERITSMRS